VSLLSKPLLAGFLATIVASGLVLLQPETAVSTEDGESLLAERGSTPALVNEVSQPWVRAPRPLPEAYLVQGLAPPPPVSIKPVVVAAPLPPPRPVAPQPAFIYLGRLMRDGQVYVFLGYNDEVEVVAVGATIGDSWRVDSVTEAGIELNYLPLNENRRLALSER
jgi:hypothetical protein